MQDLFRLLGLDEIMQQTEGDSSIKIGLIDGGIDLSNPGFCKENIQLPASAVECNAEQSFSCSHGTFVAGLLKAKRDTTVPGICPGCTLISKPIFEKGKDSTGGATVSSEEQIYQSILDCIAEGARIINLSLSQNILSRSSASTVLHEALDIASRSNVLIIAAAGNDSLIGKTMITKHPWTVTVSACDQRGYPLSTSNFSLSSASNGLLAPGHNIKGLGSGNSFRTMSGTSVAVPFVTGAAALLWSQFKTTEAAHIRYALVKNTARNRSIIPKLLNVRESVNYLKNI